MHLNDLNKFNDLYLCSFLCCDLMSSLEISSRFHCTSIKNAKPKTSDTVASILSTIYKTHPQNFLVILKILTDHCTSTTWAAAINEFVYLVSTLR